MRRGVFGVWGIWKGEGREEGWVKGGQFISNLGPEWTGSHHSKEGLQVSGRGIEKGARGRKEQGDCAMHIDNLYMCT